MPWNDRFNRIRRPCPTPLNEMFSLERRLKRHIWAGDHRFSVIVAPGLEHVCKIELSRRGARNITAFPGRIECEGPFELLYKLNLQLRSADRVFFMVREFRVKRPEKIYETFRALPWELYLHPASPRVFRFHTRETFVRTDRTFEQRLDHIISEYFGSLPAEYSESLAGLDRPERQTISLSIEQEHAQISLDSSGDPLYKRGYRRDGGEAPIRETLAAGILRHIGWKPSQPLVDAMTGSGTFAIEAALIATKKAAGVMRTFPFSQWPSFRPQRFAYVHKTAVTTQSKSAPAPIIAIDKDEHQIKRGQLNAERAGMDRMITFRTEDFFQVTPETLGLASGCLLMNLPYGKRLSKTKLRPFYYNIGNYLKQKFGGWDIALLYPATDLEPVLGIPKARYLTLTTGGTKIRLLTARLSRKQLTKPGQGRSRSGPGPAP
ncbi:hypothetical protein JXQ70_18140 [bacterium]|nr:hypothetical protein [bacterium]